MPFKPVTGFAATALMALALPAAAADLRSAAPGAPYAAPAGWLVTINGKVSVSPRYTGSDEFGFIGFPTLSFRRAGAPRTWSSPDDALSIRVVDTAWFAAGVMARYRGGRYDKDARALAGIHNVKWTIEPGVFAEAWLVPDMIRARFEVSRGFRNEDGFVGVAGLDYVGRWDAFTVAFGPRVKLGDARFMRHQFGITPAGAAAHGRLPAYRPGGGIYAAGAYASLTYKASEQWSYTLHGGYDRLVHDAASSPIVRTAGSRNQWNFGAVASYTFSWSR